MGRWSSRRSGGRALPLLDDRLLATRALGDHSSNKKSVVAPHRVTPASNACPPPLLLGHGNLAVAPRQADRSLFIAASAGTRRTRGDRAPTSAAGPGCPRPEHRHEQGRRAQTRTAALAHEPSVTVPMVAGIRPGSPRGCAAWPTGQRARRELLPAAEPTATPPSARPATRSPARWSPARAGCGASLIAPWSAPTSRPRACPAQPDQPAEVRRWPSRS